MSRLRDPRDPEKIEYPIANVLWTGVLLFLCKLGSRRQVRFLFNTPAFVQNLNGLAHSGNARVCDPDTVAYLAERLDPAELTRLRFQMVNELIRSRCLEKRRLFGVYYLIAFDGTGYRWYDQRHCPHCIKTTRNGKTYFYHQVMEAKLVTPDGFAFSVDTEFIENEDPHASKQDCELKAFHRMAPRIKKAFPRLPICALLDSLYPGKPVFDLFRKFHWKFLIVFKDGTMPAVFQEFEALKKLTPENSRTNSIPDGSQTWHWVNAIPYEGHKLNVLECQETKTVADKTNADSDSTVDITKRWVWLSGFIIHARNYRTLGDEGGRQRWRIENEGWKMQKTGGYELEHEYSQDDTATKNFYLFLQIAHFLAQLMEKGSLLKPFLTRTFGSIRNIARMLLESLRVHTTTSDELRALATQHFQIRLDSS